MRCRSAKILISGLLLIALIQSCSKQSSPDRNQADTKTSTWNRQQADLQYRQLQTEINLAQTKELYLVLDLRRMKIALKLKGAIVWEAPLSMLEPDSSAAIDFAGHFESRDGQLMRHISGKYLFAADKKTPDSILAIVGEAVNVRPELLQREVPARFQLTWNDGLILDVRTDISGKYKEPLKNALQQVKHVINRPFGETSLAIKMDPDAALTLYRAAIKGLPTMIYPPM
jgi:hypothetical protein